MKKPKKKAGQRSAEHLRDEAAAAAADAGDADKAVDELNERLAFVMLNGSAGVLCEYDDPEWPGTRDFAITYEKDMRFRYANECVEVLQSGKIKTVSKFDLWRTSPKRRSVRRLVLLPGKPPGRDPKTGDFNIWQGWHVKPHKPDAEHSWDLMQKHIHKVLARGNDEHAKFILDWSAYCVQRPDRIPETSIAFLGPEGCGKGMFCRAMVHIHGRHGVQLMGPDELVGRFNGRLKDKLLIFADEAFFAGDPKSNGVLKGMLTEPRVKVEDKFKDAYEIKNYRKLLIASNEDWVVHAGASARRYAVFRVGTARIGDHAYFKPLGEQMEHGGYEAMLWDLQHRDLSGFNPRAIPQTRELFEQKKLGFDPTTQWWFEQLQDADGTWRNGALAIPCKAVYAKVAEHTAGQYDKRALQTKIGMKLKQLCQATRIERMWNKESNTRQRAYVFPNRDTCRAAFERFVRQEINWSSGTARNTPRNGEEQ